MKRVLLSDDTTKAICGIIGGKIFKKLFMSERGEFSKIKPGLKASSLSDDEALSIAIDYRKRDFLQSFIGRWGTGTVKVIQNRIKNLEKKGLSAKNALARALLNSAFSERVNLYFSIADQGVSSFYIKEIEEKIAQISSGKNNVAPKSRIGELEEGIAQPESRIYSLTKSLGDEVIVSAIKSNEQLMSRAKKLIFEDWKKENKALLAKAQKELDSLKERLTDEQKAFEAIKEEEKKLAKAIADKELLAADVEYKVAERIQRAKESAADFITDMAFTAGGQSALAAAETIKECADDSSSPISRYVTLEGIADLDTLERHGKWSDVVLTAGFGLKKAGIADTNNAYRLASYLCAAYIEKQPLLIAGPNAREIVEAFCAALSARKRGVLYCGGEYSYNVIKSIGGNKEDIVEIVNLLSSGWLNRLPEILSVKDIFFIATHPYAEDVQVEPKSLFGFMLPLFTEFFVDNKAAGEYVGGYCAENFAEYKPTEKNEQTVRLLDDFVLNPLIRSNIERLLTVMHNINNPETDANRNDGDFMCAILQIAYATMQTSVLSESLKKNPVSEDILKKLKFALGDLRESI